MPQRQVDWAEYKAANLVDMNGRISVADVAKLLRSERARAVRVCQRLASKVKCCCPYDCAKAIGGKKP